ncbi:MAG: Fur family transcriptional regulator [Sphaerimonospora mesophila]
MQNEAVFRRQLVSHNLRLTNNRLAIFRILAAADSPLLIREIITMCTDTAHFTSVYRSILSLQQAGIIREVPRGFKIYYELGEDFRPHHHHATCERCGKTTPIDDHSVERLLHSLTIKAGLAPTKHHFELFGICQQCQKSII